MSNISKAEEKKTEEEKTAQTADVLFGGGQASDFDLFGNSSQNEISSVSLTHSEDTNKFSQPSVSDSIPFPASYTSNFPDIFQAQPTDVNYQASNLPTSTPQGHQTFSNDVYHQHNVAYPPHNVHSQWAQQEDISNFYENQNQGNIAYNDQSNHYSQYPQQQQVQQQQDTQSYDSQWYQYDFNQQHLSNYPDINQSSQQQYSQQYLQENPTLPQTLQQSSQYNTTYNEYYQPYENIPQNQFPTSDAVMAQQFGDGFQLNAQYYQTRQGDQPLTTDELEKSSRSVINDYEQLPPASGKKEDATGFFDSLAQDTTNTPEVYSQKAIEKNMPEETSEAAELNQFLDDAEESVIPNDELENINQVMTPSVVDTNLVKNGLEEYSGQIISPLSSLHDGNLTAIANNFMPEESILLQNHSVPSELPGVNTKLSYPSPQPDFAQHIPLNTYHSKSPTKQKKPKFEYFDPYSIQDSQISEEKTKASESSADTKKKHIFLPPKIPSSTPQYANPFAQNITNYSQEKDDRPVGHSKIESFATTDVQFTEASTTQISENTFIETNYSVPYSNPGIDGGIINFQEENKYDWDNEVKKNEQWKFGEDQNIGQVSYSQEYSYSQDQNANMYAQTVYEKESNYSYEENDNIYGIMQPATGYGTEASDVTSKANILPPPIQEDSYNFSRAKGHPLAFFGFGGKVAIMHPLVQTRVNTLSSSTGESSLPVTVQKYYPGPISIFKRGSTLIKQSTRSGLLKQKDPVLTNIPYIDATWISNYGDKNIFEHEWWTKKKREGVLLIEDLLQQIDFDDSVHRLSSNSNDTKIFKEKITVMFQESVHLPLMESIEKKELIERREDFKALLKVLKLILQHYGENLSKDRSTSSLLPLHCQTQLSSVLKISKKKTRSKDENHEQNKTFDPKLVFPERRIAKRNSFSEMTSLHLSEAATQIPQIAMEENNKASSGSSVENIEPTLKMIHSSLQEGQRAQAVRIALGANLWGQALILSSCIDKSLWKEVVFQFIKKQLDACDDSVKLMFALFSGDSGQSAVDEFFPSDFHDHNSVSEDLSKIWRECVLMMTSNRLASETKALIALGDKLRKDWGREEAAQVCYLLAFCSNPNTNLDDRLMLLGRPYSNSPYTFFKDYCAVKLTEYLEVIAIMNHIVTSNQSSVKGNPSLSRAPSPQSVPVRSSASPVPFQRASSPGRALKSIDTMGVFPLFQIVKLEIANELVEYGYTELAGKYLMSVANLLKFNPSLNTQIPEEILLQFQLMTEKLSSLGHYSEAIDEDSGKSWFSRKITKSTFDSLKNVFESGLDKFVSGDASEKVEPPKQPGNLKVAKHEIGAAHPINPPRIHTPMQQAYANPFAVPSASHYGTGQSPDPTTFQHTSAQVVSTPVTPVHQIPPIAQIEENEDLGFGNTALNKNKTTTEKSETKKQDEKEEDSSKMDTEGSRATMSESSYWGLFKSLTSVISRKKDTSQIGNTPTTAHLGEESSFYYDPEKKKWVNKNVSDDHLDREVKPPPPPPNSTPYVLSRSNTPANISGTTSSTPPPAPASSSSSHPPTPVLGSVSQSTGSRSVRRGARNKYVDIMNPSSSTDSTQLPLPSIPTGSRSVTNSPILPRGPRPKIMRPMGITRTTSSPIPTTFSSPLHAQKQEIFEENNGEQ